MVDIEFRTLEVLKNNLSNIRELLINLKNLKELVSHCSTSVNYWSQAKREVCYSEIAGLILRSGKINDIVKELIILNPKNINDDAEIQLILAIIKGFKNFFDKVYEIYLLDQALFLLTNLNAIDASTLAMAMNGFVTNSYLESISFGIEEKQITFYDYYYEEFYKKILDVKCFYLEQIRKLLSMPGMTEKFSYLKKVLEDITFGGADNFYINQMYILFSGLREEKVSRPNSRKRKVNPDQLSFEC